MRKLVAAPVFEGDEDKTRAARLLHVILVSIFVAAVGVVPILAVVFPVGSRFSLPIGAIAATGTLGLSFLARRGYVRAAGVLLSCMLFVVVTGTLYLFFGIRNPLVVAYFLVIAIAALLVGARAAFVFGLLCVLATVGLFGVEITIGTVIPLPASVELADAVILCAALGMGSLLLRFAVRSSDQGFEHARRNAQALAEINRELQASRDVLEARTHDLERRARYLEVTAEVARDATSVLDLQQLLSRVVNLVSERFGFYHSGIFLLDPAGEWAVLQAASSEGGQRMLARGHRLKVGEVGIVGYVTGRGEPRIALDVGADAVYFDNPDLPETRSEMALPLRARGEIIGALDVQSREPEAFSDEDVAVLQTLADQVAVTISNARLFQQAQESLEAERRAYGELSRRAWEELLRAQPDLGFLSNEQGTFPTGDRWQPEMKMVLRTGRAVPGESDTRSLAMPVRVRGHVIGVVDGHKPQAAGEWTPEEVALMETLAGQLGLALESARLYQDSQRRAARERLTGQVAAHMRETLDMDTVLQIAVREMRQALGLHDVMVRLGGTDGRRQDTAETSSQPTSSEQNEEYRSVS